VRRVSTWSERRGEEKMRVLDCDREEEEEEKKKQQQPASNARH
jgi:hypothetical protein